MIRLYSLIEIIILITILLNCQVIKKIENQKNASNENNIKEMSDIFKEVLGSFQSGVNYTLLKEVKDSYHTIVVNFETLRNDNYQLIVLKWEKDKKCSIENENGISDFYDIFMGPGGSGYTIDFCVREKQYTLSFSGLLDNKDKGHGIDPNDFVIKIKERIENR